MIILMVIICTIAITVIIIKSTDKVFPLQEIKNPAEQKEEKESAREEVPNIPFSMPEFSTNYLRALSGRGSL